MQWIKEVELTDSVDEIRSSSSTRGISKPNFEVFDARIASALNKIIYFSDFKTRIRLEEQKVQKQDRFLRDRQIAHLIYDHFRVTGSHDFLENYTELFTIVPRSDNIQEFDSKWDGILSMTKIPHDDILEGLFKLRIRESEKLKTELELYDLETHLKKACPYYHKLKRMVKRSIEQEIRNKNLGSRSGNFEKNAAVKNQGTKQRVQRILEIVGDGNSTGSVWKETLAVSVTIWISVKKLHHQIRLRIHSCSKVSENHRELEVPQAEVPAVERLDGFARIPLEEHAITHFVKNGTLQNARSTSSRVVVGLGKSVHSHVVRLMNNRQRIMTKVQWLCWKKEIGKKEDLLPINAPIDLKNLVRGVIKSWDIQRVKFTKAIARHTKIRDQNPSLGYICPGAPHERSPNAPKFEDRSQEETEWQEQGAREAAWKLAKRVLNFKEQQSNILLTFGKQVFACITS